MGAEPLGEAGVRLRAFFGLPLPEAHRSALNGFLAECSARAPEFRWTPAANLHLTIRFLGQVEESVAEAIAGRLDAAGLKGFELRLGDLGAFKRGRLARVVWLGLAAGSGAAGELATVAEAACVAARLEPETRPYHAHLTLARARPRDGAVLQELSPPPDLPAWRAEELILYRSRPGRGGSVYEPLQTIPLS